VCQETLLRAWKNASLLDEAQGSVRAWLFTVARNIVIDESRTRRSRSEFPMGELPEPVPTEDASDELLMTWVVADAVTRLSPEHRAVLQQTYFKGRPVAEAARRLGIPEGTVKSRTHYALHALRLALEEMGVVA
jgi:RNA polymerase sigma-70 factor, ECF subfamily